MMVGPLPESVLVFSALTIAVGLLFFAAACSLPREIRVATRGFWCPFRRTDVVVEFQEDPFGRGRYLDVKRCTVFPAGFAITCRKACRYLRDFPEGRAA